ncbi:MAG: hypothetical protein LBG99_02305 [Propionibacteriaceae bacterium]|jgi:hypothetical protein|nr:hypothetical protein [Propionibacteriaceae bacterium]
MTVAAAVAAALALSDADREAIILLDTNPLCIGPLMISFAIDIHPSSRFLCPETGVSYVLNQDTVNPTVVSTRHRQPDSVNLAVSTWQIGEYMA